MIIIKYEIDLYTDLKKYYDWIKHSGIVDDTIRVLEANFSGMPAGPT